MQYANGIVDFQEAHCIGCGYCVTGCPFNIPKFSPEAHKVFKCTLCNDRVSVGLEPACIKTCPDGLSAFRDQIRNERTGRNARVSARSQSGFPDAGVYDPPGVSGTHVIYVLHDAKNPELYGGLPSDPHVPWSVRLWKGPLKWLGNLAMIGGLVGLAVHYMRFGPKKEEPIAPTGSEAGMSTIDTVPRPRTETEFDEELIPRYSMVERLNHWFGALTYGYCLITGLAFWSPYLYWLASIVGGGPTARFWHPWFGIFFTVSQFLMFMHWATDMEVDNDDRVWADKIQSLHRK